MFEHGFPPYWSTIKKLIWLVGTGIVGGVTEIWKTVTGTIIHITDALEAPMQKCEVTLEPIQDLHGQDAPYPAGGGKNKIDQTTLEQGGISNTDGQDYDALPERQVRNNGYCPVKGDTSYTLSADISFSLVTTYVYFYDASKNYLSGTDRSAATLQFTFSTPSNCAFLRFKVYSSSAGCSPSDIANLQLEEGSLKTTFATYSNICPIGYWNGCDVTWTGKNVFGGIELARKIKELVPSAVLDENAKTITYSASSMSGKIFFTDFEPNTRYTIILRGSGPAANMCCIYSNGATLNFSLNEAKVSASNLSLSRLQGQYATGTTVLNYEECGIIRGVATLDDFEPYQGNIYSVDFPAMGHNQWDEEWELGDIDNDGQPTPSTTLTRAKNFNACKPDTAYYVKKPSTVSLYMKFYDKDKNFIYPTISANGEITTPQNCYYFKFVLGSAYGTTYNHDVSINYPSTFTTYEPYYSVYGGTVDLVSGVLTVTYFLYTVTKDTPLSAGSGYNKTNTTDRYVVVNNAISNGYTVDSKAKSDILKYVFNNAIWLNDNQSALNTFTLNSKQLHMNFENTTVGIEVSDDSSARTAKIKTWLENNPITFAIPLATPITYQLTPQQISTFKGENNVWSNSNGDTTIIYKAQAE